MKCCIEFTHKCLQGTPFSDQMTAPLCIPSDLQELVSVLAITNFPAIQAIPEQLIPNLVF